MPLLRRKKHHAEKTPSKFLSLQRLPKRFFDPRRNHFRTVSHSAPQSTLHQTTTNHPTSQQPTAIIQPTNIAAKIIQQRIQRLDLRLIQAHFQQRQLTLQTTYCSGGKKSHRARSGSSGATAPGSVCFLLIFSASPVNPLKGDIVGGGVDDEVAFVE